MLSKLVCVFWIGIFTDFAFADVYLHNPRGSNNRWNENGRNRNNANRMFDSQNNDRGGYNVGSLYYHAGSKLQIEWTNQHSCGNENNNCNIIIQYMCGNLVRDGTTTATIPDNPAQCENLDCNEDRRYGMHEDFYSYAHCKMRNRNKGLFTADRNVGDTAKRTRQNQNGNRFGYECPEEKDYYPYWGPTQWKDIVVMTNDVSRCDVYQQESQNVKPKYACKVSISYLYQKSRNPPKPYIPITKEECEEFEYEENGETKKGVWQEYEAHGIAAPACVESQWSRDNHLGNGIGGQTLNYNWTLPDVEEEHCALRIRYNISTGDYDGQNTTSAQNNRGNRKNTPSGVDLWTEQGLTEAEGEARGYQLRGNPQVDIFDNVKLKLQLAINTAQYGRTFQDRSHTFAIRPRPPSIPKNAEIFNLNVRGKRGNIVQVYPAVEYDFVPNTLEVEKDSYVHIQWTGSNNNPNNNDGQGRAGTDRSNMLMLKKSSYVEGNPENKKNTFGQLGASYPAYLPEASIGGFSKDDLISLAVHNPYSLGGDLDELDDSSTYYDLGARKVTMAGVYNYMSTRNNNFSNRSQKGRIIVTNSAVTYERVDKNGGTIVLKDNQENMVSSVMFPPMAVTSAVHVEVREIAPEDISMLREPQNTDYVSPFIKVAPTGKLTIDNSKVEITIQLSTNVGGLFEASLYKSNSDMTSWYEIHINSQSGKSIAFSTDTGGHYVVSKRVAPGPMAGLVIGLVVGVLLLVAIIVLVRKNKLTLAGYKSKV